MSETPENARRFQRVSVGPECRVQFVAAKNMYDDLPVQNISLGGCGILIPALAAQLLEKDMLLRELVVNHPKLPCVPLQGRVAFLLGKHNPDPDAVSVVGIEFIDQHPDFKLALESLIAELTA